MSLTVKHEGFGRWAVMAGETKVATGLTKSEAVAQTTVTAPLAETEVVFPPIPTNLSENERRRIYEQRLNDQERRDRFAMEGRVKDWIMTEFGHDEDTATRLSMTIAPMIAAGREGVNRNIARNRRGAMAVAATA